jgi:hypothetical protein
MYVICIGSHGDGHLYCITVTFRDLSKLARQLETGWCASHTSTVFYVNYSSTAGGTP